MSTKRVPQFVLLFALLTFLAPTSFAAGTREQGKALNPYDQHFAKLKGQFPGATPPQAAVLLARAYKLREYVEDRSGISKLLEGVAGDTRQNRLVRDEALRYLALIDIHENRLAEAENRLTALGVVRAWSVIGPFAAPRAIDAQYGPENGYSVGKTYKDQSGKARNWRAAPGPGPQMWTDIADLYPRAGASVAFAATAVYSDIPQQVALRFSAEGPVILFANSRQVFTERNELGLGFDQHTVAVELQPGWNQLLLKLAHSGTGSWRFGLRITALEGGGMPLKASSGQSEAQQSAPSSARAQATDLVDMAKAAADADPGSAAALETLGHLEFEHARGSELEHLETAAQRSPTPERWLTVAERCSESSCTFRALNAALRLDAENEPARVALASYYFGRGQLEKARNLLQKAIEREPGDFVARSALADLYVSAGLTSEALQQSRQLVQDFPGPLWLKRKLAARYLDSGLIDDAVITLQAALHDNFDGERERALLRQAYERSGNAAGLRTLYEETLRVQPSDTASLTQLATLDAGAGNHSAASQHMQEALAIAPEDDELHAQWATLLARAGRHDAERAELDLVLASNPNREDARLRLELTARGGDQADTESAYLEDPAALASNAHSQPPASTSNAVTLSTVRVERVYDNGLSAVREQLIHYISSEQGARDFSTRSVQYAPGSQELRVLNARVYKADGRVLQAEEVGEGAVAEANVAMYYDVRSRQLRFPALEPGDVVELDYRISPTTNVNPYGDYFGGLVVFRGKLPQQLQRYVLITPLRRRLNVLEQRMEPGTVTTQGDERIYRWEARNSEALPNEARGPALTDFAPYVHVSTFQSWEELGRWYAQLIQPQFALDGALRDASAHLLKNAQTERERITAIHQFVLRNTHYVAMEFGIYSYKPYRVSQVYARRFGDCKDKASLMIALLRQAGIEADIALVRTRRLGSIDPQATSIALFNHAIVYVPKYDLWLDGTAEYAGSSELPMEDQGATALTVSLDGRATLRQIPITKPQDNYTRRTVRAQVLPNGRIQFTGVAYTRGEDAPGLRREYETPERQRDAMRNTLSQVFPSVQLDDVRVEGANDLEHPVTVEFRGELDSFAGYSSIPLAASWMPRSYVQQLAALTSRSLDMLLPAPWTTDEELHFDLPAGASVRMPADSVLESKFGTATLRYQRVGHELVVRTSVQFRQLRITPAEYGQFRDFCQQIERAFHNEIKVDLRG